MRFSVEYSDNDCNISSFELRPISLDCRLPVTGEKVRKIILQAKEHNEEDCAQHSCSKVTVYVCAVFSALMHNFNYVG